MMIHVVGRAVHNRFEWIRYPIIAIVDRDGPHVDKHKQNKIREFVERKHKGINVVRTALEESIDGMEGVAGKGRRYLERTMKMIKFCAKHVPV
jgi:hypothetical protein